ncbi:MAG TPA: hypothetical protein VII63_08480 [Caulobacteraceae bacterium]
MKRSDRRSAPEMRRAPPPTPLLLLALAACQTTGSSARTEIPAPAAPPPAATACAIFAPIRWSARDTLQTQKQAVVHNARWKALCAPAKP